MFHLSEHVGLSLVRNGEGGGTLLPWLSIHLNWNTLMNYDLKREGRRRRELITSKSLEVHRVEEGRRGSSSISTPFL